MLSKRRKRNARSVAMTVRNVFRYGPWFFAAMVLTLPAEVSVSATLGPDDTGFEEGTVGWTCPQNAKIDACVAHSGRRSMRIAVKDRSKDALWMTRRIPVQSGANYDISCFVKTEDLSASGTEKCFGAGLIVEWIDKNGKWYDSGAVDCGGWGSKDWTSRKCRLRAPEKAGYALVYLAVHAVGTAWFDDFVFTAVKTPTEKVSPENGSVISNNCPRFSWHPVGGARRCRLELSRDPSFSKGTVKDFDVGGRMEFQLKEPLEPGKWHWRVGVTGSLDARPWSFVQTAPRERDCLPPQILTKAYRIRSGKEEVRVKVRERSPRDAKVAFLGVDGELAGGCGNDEFELVFKAPAKGWPKGFVEGKIDAEDSVGNRQSSVFWLLNAPCPANSVSIDKDGFYEESGRRIFPLGIYEVAPKYMPQVRAAGWDAVHLYEWERTKDNEACRKYLDSCWESNGLRAFIGFCRGVKSRTGIVQGDFASVARRVGAIADHPALFCWYLFDEPELANQFVSPDLLKEFADLVRALDPYHPVVVSTWPGVTAQMYDYRHAWDTYWSQAYGDPAGVAKQIDNHRSRLKFDSPITLLASCNDRQQGKMRQSGKEPDTSLFDRDLDHLRACAFLSVVKQCNGVFWWWFARDTHETYPASQSPKGWADLVQVVRELRNIRPFVVADGAVMTGTAMAGKDCIQWWRKVIGDDILFIAVNTADHPVSATIAIPGDKIRRLDLRRHEVRMEGFGFDKMNNERSITP